MKAIELTGFVFIDFIGSHIRFAFANSKKKLFSTARQRVKPTTLANKGFPRTNQVLPDKFNPLPRNFLCTGANMSALSIEIRDASRNVVDLNPDQGMIYYSQTH